MPSWFASTRRTFLALAGCLALSSCGSHDTVVQSKELAGHLALDSAAMGARIGARVSAREDPSVTLRSRIRWNPGEAVSSEPGSAADSPDAGTDAGLPIISGVGSRQILVQETSCTDSCVYDLWNDRLLVVQKTLDHLERCTVTPCDFAIDYKLLGTSFPGRAYVDWTLQAAIELDLDLAGQDTNIRVEPLTSP